MMRFFFTGFIILNLLLGILLHCKQDSTVLGNKAKVIVERANLRVAPLALSAIVEILPRDTELYVWERTLKKVKIGGRHHYWYKVRLENDIEGWLYGSLLSF